MPKNICIASIFIVLADFRIAQFDTERNILSRVDKCGRSCILDNHEELGEPPRVFQLATHTHMGSSNTTMMDEETTQAPEGTEEETQGETQEEGGDAAVE